jgi:hypothetical protein
MQTGPARKCWQSEGECSARAARTQRAGRAVFAAGAAAGGAVMR